MKYHWCFTVKWVFKGFFIFFFYYYYHRSLMHTRIRMGKGYKIIYSPLVALCRCHINFCLWLWRVLGWEECNNGGRRLNEGKKVCESQMAFSLQSAARSRFWTISTDFLSEIRMSWVITYCLSLSVSLCLLAAPPIFFIFHFTERVIFEWILLLLLCEQGEIVSMKYPCISPPILFKIPSSYSPSMLNSFYRPYLPSIRVFTAHLWYLGFQFGFISLNELISQF